MRRFVLGDVHGAKRALDQVIERSGIDPKKDLLVFLGDVADGWPNTKDCIDTLLGFDNMVALRGNHDTWFMEWVFGFPPQAIWTSQGGNATLESYGASRWTLDRSMVPDAHKLYLKSLVPWHQIEDKIFVHGGWNWWDSPHPMGDTAEGIEWDRSLLYHSIEASMKGQMEPLVPHGEVYVGHTSIWKHSHEPKRFLNVWGMDTGGGWEGKLSLMDIDSKQVWQSDIVATLYPEYRGRQ